MTEILSVCDSSGLGLRTRFCPFQPLNVLLLQSFSVKCSSHLSTVAAPLLKWPWAVGPSFLPAAVLRGFLGSCPLAFWRALAATVTAHSWSGTSSCFKSLSGLLLLFKCPYTFIPPEYLADERWSYPPHAPMNSLCAHLKVFIFKIAKLVLFYKLSLHVTVVR